MKETKKKKINKGKEKKQIRVEKKEYYKEGIKKEKKH